MGMILSVLLRKNVQCRQLQLPALLNVFICDVISNYHQFEVVNPNII